MEVVSRVESDHLPIEFKLALNMVDRHPVNIVSRNRREGIYTPKYVWRGDKKQSYILSWFDDEIIDLIDKANSAVCLDYDEAITLIENTFAKAGCVMKDRCSFKSNPIVKNCWFDNECKDLKHRARRELNKYRLLKTNDTRHHYIASRRIYINTIRRKKANWRVLNQNKLLHAIDSCDSKAFWSLIKSKNDYVVNIQMRDWEHHFSDILGKGVPFDGSSLTNSFPLTESQTSALELANLPICRDDVEMVIKNLRNGKAPGVDGILVEFVKNCHPIMIGTLHKLFDCLYSNGIFPERWKTNIIIPVHKGGDKEDPNNYRGISLMSVLGKLFSMILLERIQRWVEDICPLSQSQFGFRKGFRSSDNVFILHTIVSKYLSRRRGRVYVAFIDFRKAFDCIDRQILLQILSVNGLRGKLFNVLTSLYNNLKFCIRDRNGYSNVLPCYMGVQQGSPLSPLLFNLFIDSINNEMDTLKFHGVQIGGETMTHLLYADDLVLFSYSVMGLQRLLDGLTRFSKDFSLQINMSKSKIVVFKRGGILKRNEKWHLGGERIEVVKSYNYLGLLMSNSGSFSGMYNKLANQGLRAFYSLKRSLQQFGDIPVKTSIKVFDSKVLPILNFGCEIWGLNEANCIEQVHHLFCKHVLKVPLNSSNCAVRAELGRPKLYMFRCKTVIAYWIRLLSLPHSHYSYFAYEEQLSIAERGVECWALSLKRLLFSLGFGDAWLNQGVGNCRAFMILVEQRLSDIHWQNGIGEIRNNRKLQTYSILKSCHGFEKYLSCVKNPLYRQSLCKLRISAHNLHVETGRWTRIPINSRLCILCNEDHIEDEFHFLLVCPAYHHIRVTYIPTYYYHFPTIDKFYNLMQSKNSAILNNLSKYIYISIKKRQDLIDNIC